MIRKSYLLGILLACASASCWASWTSGLYVGAGVGPDLGDFRQKAHVKEMHGSLVGFDVKDKQQKSGTGVFGTLFAGYGKRLSDMYPCLPCYLYLAGELNANISSLKHKSSNDEFVHHNFSSTKFRIQNNYGASVIPGIIYCDSMLYGRIGYANGKFKISTSDKSLKDVSQRLDGTRWGVGLEQKLMPGFSARVEFSHITYVTKRIFTFDAASEVSKTTKFKPHTNQVEFGLLYNFC